MKYAWMETHSDLFSVSRMSRLFDVSRTGYCQWRVRAPSERSIANATLDAQVAAIHAATNAATVGHVSCGICTRAVFASAMSECARA